MKVTGMIKSLSLTDSKTSPYKHFFKLELFGSIDESQKEEFYNILRQIHLSRKQIAVTYPGIDEYGDCLSTKVLITVREEE